MAKSFYRDYFEIDENYFPCVNESAINAGLKWENFYPHDTFIDLLRKTDRILSRQEKRSLWIFGAYGTGKSYAGFALSRLLTASPQEVEGYFDKYDALAHLKKDLMQRLIGYKQEGRILTCYRYASSAIKDTNDLIIVIQELIAKALDRGGYAYKGENTLKTKILAWLEDERNKNYFAAYLEKEYKELFGGWNTDDIIDRLKKPESQTELVGKISQMASEVGFRHMEFDMDGLIAYIKDIIEGNHLKALVFVLDEFSEFFDANRGRLTDFQKLVEICAETPFYLMVIAHQMGSYFHEKDTDAKKIKDRFLSCEIAMPDNIAFDLMKDALKIKPAAKNEWETKLDDLQAYTTNSRRDVSECTGISTDVLKGVLPLHPMSALLLKHISSAFESNQRSMFDFIKNDGDYQAFQWFIDNHSPLDGTTAFLTVDMLWDFFYETGKESLSLPIRNILDTYQRSEQRGLMDEEKRVLRTVLILQAVSLRLNDAIPLFIANEKNLDLCFEGTDYEHRAPSIADKLVREEVLYKKPLGNNKFCYSVMVMAGDAVELDKKKTEISEKLRTKDLLTDQLTRNFSLPAWLRIRYNLSFSTCDTLSIDINRLINDAGESGFYAIIGVAKDENEAVQLCKLMKEKIAAINSESKNIVLIDTTPTPFGSDRIDQYAEYMAASEIQRGRDRAASDELLQKGYSVVKDWSDKIYNGQMIVYSRCKPEGERFDNWQRVLDGLRNLVKTRYPQALEFESGLSETALQPGSAQQWIEAGLVEKSSGLTACAEKLVNSARKDEKYWINDPYGKLGCIKNKLDQKIKDELDANSKISIMDILMYLINEFGFVPSKLYSFITGFLLKEYANGTYRLSDEANSEKLTVDKMKEIVDEGFKQVYAPPRRYRDKFIRILSQEEQVFCELMSDVFEISETLCGSVEDTLKHVRNRAKKFGLPFWVLKEQATGIEDDFITELIKLLNPEQGTNTSIVSGQIGRLAEKDKSLEARLKTLIKPENFDSAMKSFLKDFDGGKLLALAEEIHVPDDTVVSSIKDRFGSDSEGLWLWNQETGEREIQKVIREYEFIKKSNELLSTDKRSLNDAFSAWKEKLKFIKVSHEIVSKETGFAPLIVVLYEVAKGLGGDTTRKFYDVLIDHGHEIVNFFELDKTTFAKYFEHALRGLSPSEIEEVYNKMPLNCFVMSENAYLSEVDKCVSDYKSSLAKTQLRNLWLEKTATDTPEQWSEDFQTPILACVPIGKWKEYHRAFDAVNRKNSGSSEVEFAYDYLNANPIWDDIQDQEKVDNAFVKVVLGRYKAVLTDLHEVRNYLGSKTSVKPYDWSQNPEVKRLIKELAQCKYSEEPFERVVRRIESMDGDKLKEYLKRLVKENMTVGIEILEDAGK